MKRAFIAGILCISLLISSGGTALAAESSDRYDAADLSKPYRAEDFSAEGSYAQGSYREGEAIAIVRGREEPQVAGSIERLAEVSPASLQAVTEEWQASGSEMEVKQDRMQGIDIFTVWSITDQDRSAAQIIGELYADPNVIAAEPNYLSYADQENAPAGKDNSSEEAGSEGSNSELTGSENKTGSGQTGSEDETGSEQTDAAARADLSFMQWYAGDTASEDSKAANYTTPLSPTSSYSLEVPGWQEGHTDVNAPANASGTICVMDSGIDTEHPDLQGVLYEFTPEQQARYGCGKYGMNASGDGDPENVPKVVSSHGTHVAGIIAANWDGNGISGVANGVKIFSVNVFGGDGNVQELKSTIKGFQFLIDAAQEVNLKAVNCSWGTGQMHFSLAVMMEELGRKGVNTVIASGNRYCDLDETMDLSVLTNSPYAIVVDAASMDGSMTDFSCWGQQSTDVFAPGSSILSDVSAYVRIEAEGQLFNFQDDTSFYPEVTDKEHLLSSIEQFSEETPAVRFFDENPALNDAAREIGEINTANGFDDKRSFSVRVPELHKEAQMPNGGYSAINGYVYLAIPVPAGADPRWISVKTAMSDGFKPNGGIDSITCAGTDGKPVEIDCTCVNPGKKGLNASAFYHIYQCQWNNLSYDVAGFIDASNAVHRMLEKGMDENERRSQGLLDYRDPGEIRGVYTWEDGGQTYLIARIGIGNVTEDSRSLEVADDTSLYIDNVAVGDADAFTGAYLLMSGTSMAAPAVAGCLGVIAKDEPENASLTDAELAQAARERAAKLMAAVDYDESLSGYCRTGGRVNLHGQTEFTRKAPLIGRAQAENRVLKLAGWYFGSKGTLAIDGTEIPVRVWEDEQIEADIQSLSNGSHVVTVTNEEGAVSRAVFSFSVPDAEGRMLFEESHSLPIDDPAFVATMSDRIYGPSIISGGKLYVMTMQAKYNCAQGFWCYDLSKDKWAPVSMPERFATGQLPFSSFASVKDTLYLYGSVEYEDEDGTTLSRSCLWRYDTGSDSWEQLQVLMPTGAAGICELGDELFVIGGNIFDDVKLEGTPAGEDGGYMSGFYKVDLERDKLIRVGGDYRGENADSEMKVVSSNDKLYIYYRIEDVSYAIEPGQETKISQKPKYGEVVSDGVFLRASYDPEKNAMVMEDITPVLDASLGGELRTEYEYKKGVDSPAEHFTIAGLENGVAIVGSNTPGADVHILYDTAEKAQLYERASCYHKAFNPIAAYDDGKLYVIGYNATEPDVMYFRSDTIRPQAAADNSGAAYSSTGAGSGAGVDSGVDGRMIGLSAIGLAAVLAATLLQIRKKGNRGA